ncbi:hypothetical protein Taro_050388, partial [Colocasia esculenta]|nr:hypothetical protein [Colocasia esculenta]
MEVLRPVPKHSLRILLTKGTVPLKDNTTPITPAGLLLFPGQEGSPLLYRSRSQPPGTNPSAIVSHLVIFEIVSHLVIFEIVSHLVIFEVCKHRRKCL